MNFNEFLNESSLKPMGLSKDETKKVAETYAKAISKLDGGKCTVNMRTLEEDSFDLDFNGEEFDGGSYSIDSDGNVYNNAMGVGMKTPPIYGKWNDSVDAIIKNIKKISESVVTEAAKFKNTENFEDFLEEIDGMPESAIKKIMGKDYIDTPGGYADEAEDYDNDIIEYMISNMGRKEFEKLQDWWESNVAESVVTEAKALPLDKLVDMVGDKPTCYKLADFVYTNYDKVTGLRKSMRNDEMDFPMEIVDLVDHYGFDIDDFTDKYGMAAESVVNERNITIKRQYTENHPAVVVGKAAKIRNKVLEAIKDGKISQEEFDNLLKEMTADSKRWLRRNSRHFNVSEDGISLSKSGKSILKNVMVSEATTNEGLNYKKLAKQFVDDEWLDADDNIEDLDADEYFDDKLNAFNREELGNSKEFDNNKTNMSIEIKKLLKGRLKQIFEATEKAPKIWVPGGFDKAISKYPNNKITRKIVLDAAVKWEVDPEDAISYVEYGWAIDLDENKNTKDMKTKFIYESFAEFVENKLNEGTLNEAFASAKLASLLMGAYAMPKDLPQAFYNMSKLALDKIQDIDIIELTPEQAKKEKRESAVYLYFTTNEKENPYAGKNSWNATNVPANTLLAITDGSNEWMNAEWSKYSKQATGRTLVKTKRDDSAGLNKSSASDQYGTGISSLKQVVDLADRAYCLDLTILRARYSTTALKAEREAARKGATAIMDPRAFRDENKARYNAILAQKASELPMDKIVLDAIEELSNQIKDALVNAEKGKYGELIMGLDPKGREVKLSDASNLMRGILDEYQRYVGDVAASEKEVAAGYGTSYYDRSIKERSKNIMDRVKKIENKNYGW